MPTPRLTDQLARPGVLRYLGLFGAVCCAIDGYLFGASKEIRRNVNLVTILLGRNGVLIVVLWVAGLGALCVAWWFGRRLTGAGLLSIRWIVLTAALWIVPMLVIPPLASRDLYANACQGALFDAGFNPYLVGVSAQPCPWLDSVSVVWRDTPTPYGPVFLVLAGLAAAFGSQVAALVVLRLLAVVGVAAIAVSLPVLAKRLEVPADRAMWLVLCCPVVPIHLIGGGHNDAITVGLMVAGFAVLAARPERIGPLIAGGLLLGAAIAVKVTVGVVLPFAALLVAGGLAAGGWARLIRLGAPIVLSALGFLVAASFASGLGLGWATALSGAGESVNWSSAPTALSLTVETAGHWFGARVHVLAAVRAAALVLLGISLLVILWRSRDRDPLAGAGLSLLAVVFFAPIAQPWYLFWALALFAVSSVRARWLAGTIVFYVATILPEGTGVLRPIVVPMSFAMVALIGWVAWRSVRWLRGAEMVPWQGVSRRPGAAGDNVSAPPPGERASGPRHSASA